MPKWIIIWNNGQGENVDVVEADTIAEATTAAYEAARQDWEDSVADYSAKPWTVENAEEYELDCRPGVGE
jgi:hypothetical protein